MPVRIIVLHVNLLSSMYTQISQHNYITCWHIYAVLHISNCNHIYLYLKQFSTKIGNNHFYNNFLECAFRPINDIS